MPTNKKKFKGIILSEDRRTERFFRELLGHLGFTKHKLTFETAPSGKGDAAAWVRARYPIKVRLLRQKRNQRLFLIAVRDGDNVGVLARKADLDGAEPRERGERIAIPVPTWSIETWLLALLGDDGVEESTTRKHDFEKRFPGKEERLALRNAAEAWRGRADKVPSVPSLADGNAEISRIDSA